MDLKKVLLAIATIVWSGFVVAAYFVVQKPLAMQVADHLIALLWTFAVTSMLLFNALALGTLTLQWFIPDAADHPSLLALAGGIGLGEIGLLGFAFAAAGTSHLGILLAAQILLLGWFLWRGTLKSTCLMIRSFLTQIKSSGSLAPAWMKWAAILALLLTFLMTLLPPADAFDALLYHLAIPERWLRDGGLQAYNFPHYWFPGLVEGVYFWGLGLGSEIVPQQDHFSWTLFTGILVWDWTRRTWSELTAWWALMLLISMPSVLLLASWAYTDMVLVFFGAAMLYTLSYGREQADTRWWALSAISAGMAMGVKYTSFVMPVTGVVLISIWKFHEKRILLVAVLRFALLSVITASLWYLRNWIWMGNPIYPFLLGGRYWDPFRSAWFAGAGTGTGWDIKALFLLPLTITLGYQDINFIDADIGPLLLLALPSAVWVLARTRQVETPRQTALSVISFFTFFSTAFWVYGYITTHNLWQTRLLLPALVPFVIPAAVGIAALPALDTKRLRLSFIVTGIALASIYINLLDMGLSVLGRNPLSIAAGIVTRQTYFEKYQPAYAHAVQMVLQTARDVSIYSLFEPRSYGMQRNVQPDTILDSFSHDVFLYGTPEKIVEAWRLRGFTHVLISVRATDAVLADKSDKVVFDQTMELLKPISASPDGSYELLEIPVPER